MTWINGKYPGTVPEAITPQIVEFAEQYGEKPQYVTLKPLPFAEQKQCYGNCDLAQQIFGGTMVLGYSIWTTNDLFLSSEHHCVWRQPDGDLLDVTPDLTAKRRTLFVPTREIGPHEDPEGIVDDIVFNGDNGDFFVLVSSPLVEKAVDTLRTAAHRLHRLGNEAVKAGEPVSDAEIDRFDRAMDTVDYCIDGYYVTVRKREYSRSRRQRRKRRKIARARRR